MKNLMKQLKHEFDEGSEIALAISIALLVNGFLAAILFIQTFFPNAL